MSCPCPFSGRLLALFIDWEHGFYSKTLLSPKQSKLGTGQFVFNYHLMFLHHFFGLSNLQKKRPCPCQYPILIFFWWKFYIIYMDDIWELNPSNLWLQNVTLDNNAKCLEDTPVNVCKYHQERCKGACLEMEFLSDCIFPLQTTVLHP